VIEEKLLSLIIQRV